MRISFFTVFQNFTAEEPKNGLLTDVQSTDDFSIAFFVLAAQVVEETTTLANKLEKTATSRMIFFKDFEMLSQLIDTACQKSDLNFRRASICAVTLEVLNNFRTL